MAAAIQPAKTYGLVLSASSLKGDNVVNHQGEDLGKIEEIMIDLDRGRIAFAVLSFGGFLGMGDKLFAIPWQAFSVDTVQKRLVLNTKKELLKRRRDLTRATGQTWQTPLGDPRFTGITATSPTGIDAVECFSPSGTRSDIFDCPHLSGDSCLSRRGLRLACGGCGREC